MDKMEARKTALVIGYVDVVLSSAAVVCTILVVIAIVHPVWYSESDNQSGSTLANGSHYNDNATNRISAWANPLDAKYYLEKYSTEWVYTGVGVFYLFTLIGNLAGIALIKATNPNEANDRALAMVIFWMYCNIPLFIVYFAAGILFKWFFVLAVIRPINTFFVWHFLEYLRQYRPRDCINFNRPNGHAEQANVDMTLERL